MMGVGRLAREGGKEGSGVGEGFKDCVRELKV